MIVLIDNYDSFVHNLAGYFECLGQRTSVMRNDRVDVREVAQLRPDALVISPGPCTPDQAGCSLDLVRGLSGHLPILGVCLGHQVIAQAGGASIVRAPEPVHGRTSSVVHEGRGLLRGLPSPLEVCRYHSLIVEAQSLPECFEVQAQTSEGIIMAIQHRRQLTFGLQFHPEAILTEHGFEMLSTFLRLAGLPSNPLDDIPPRRRLAAKTLSPMGHHPSPVTF